MDSYCANDRDRECLKTFAEDVTTQMLGLAWHCKVSSPFRLLPWHGSQSTGKVHDADVDDGEGNASEGFAAHETDVRGRDL